MIKYIITSSNVEGTVGLEFEVPDDATEEEIHEAAFETVAEDLSFDYEVKG